MPSHVTGTIRMPICPNSCWCCRVSGCLRSCTRTTETRCLCSTVAPSWSTGSRPTVRLLPGHNTPKISCRRCHVTTAMLSQVRYTDARTHTHTHLQVKIAKIQHLLLHSKEKQVLSISGQSVRQTRAFIMSMTANNENLIHVHKLLLLLMHTDVFMERSLLEIHRDQLFIF